jgi:formamidopyrimidine-DNA glycosylase
VGNIYAAEALFRAGIRPGRAAGRLTRAQCGQLAACVRDVLTEALAQGGSSVRDFAGADGAPGYFQQTLNVYGREGRPCRVCGTPVKRVVIGQRASCYCPGCQH